MANLFHTQIGFPQNVAIPTHFTDLRPTFHAKQAASDDRYGKFRLPIAVHGMPFEVEVDGATVTKAAIRVSYDDTRDITVVIRGKTIVTAWLNSKNDSHRTLDTRKYSRP